jgi:hypothetical protein
MTAPLTPEQQAALAERMAEAQRQFQYVGVAGVEGRPAPRATNVHEPLLLDDVCFLVDEKLRSEIATCAGEHIGDVLLDGTASWFARKLKPDGETFGEWKHMRSAAEARAYIVSKVRQ